MPLRSVKWLKTAALSWNETGFVTIIVSHVSLTGFEASLSTLASVSQRWWPSERKKKQTEKERFNDKSENNPPTWLPTEMKKWNEHCYYYLLHQLYIKQLQRTEGIAHVILSDPPLMSSYSQSNKPKKETTERERDTDTDKERERGREIWCNPKKTRVIPKRWATSLVDERNLDFIAVWNPNMLEQLVRSLMHNDWKLTTRLDFQTSYFLCSHRNLSVIPI